MRPSRTLACVIPFLLPLLALTACSSNAPSTSFAADTQQRLGSTLPNGYNLWYPAQVGVKPGQIWTISDRGPQLLHDAPEALPVRTDDAVFASSSKATLDGRSVGVAAGFSAVAGGAKLSWEDFDSVAIDLSGAQVVALTLQDLTDQTLLDANREWSKALLDIARGDTSKFLISAAVTTKSLNYLVETRAERQTSAAAGPPGLLARVEGSVTEVDNNTYRWSIPSENEQPFTIGHQAADLSTIADAVALVVDPPPELLPSWMPEIPDFGVTKVRWSNVPDLKWPVLGVDADQETHPLPPYRYWSLNPTPPYSPTHSALLSTFHELPSFAQHPNVQALPPMSGEQQYAKRTLETVNALFAIAESGYFDKLWMNYVLSGKNFGPVGELHGTRVLLTLTNVNAAANIEGISRLLDTNDISLREAIIAIFSNISNAESKNRSLVASFEQLQNREARSIGGIANHDRYMPIYLTTEWEWHRDTGSPLGNPQALREYWPLHSCFANNKDIVDLLQSDAPLWHMAHVIALTVSTLAKPRENHMAAQLFAEFADRADYDELTGHMTFLISPNMSRYADYVKHNVFAPTIAIERHANSALNKDGNPSDCLVMVAAHHIRRGDAWHPAHFKNRGVWWSLQAYHEKFIDTFMLTDPERIREYNLAVEDIIAGAGDRREAFIDFQKSIGLYPIQP